MWCDVTYFVLHEIEWVDTFEVVGTDMPDVALNETENVVLPGNFENILTNSCVDTDVSCSGSTNTINVLPVTSKVVVILMICLQERLMQFV